ncbi:MAG: nucleotide exchange factor GrpE [Cetobacterium sp.]
MDIQYELKKFTKKILEEEILILKDDLQLENIEQSIKKEIKKGTMFVQNEIVDLKNQIENSNKESDELKKEVFNLKKDLNRRNNLLINIIQNYSVIKGFSLSKEDVKKLELIENKEKYILGKENIECLAEIGKEFNPKYHEALNNNIESKVSYVIKEILEQGYRENGNILKYAKVIVE